MSGGPTFRILEKLQNVKQRSPDRWIARCPGHDDAVQSLAIGVGDNGNAILHCFANCSTPDILRSLGLGMSALFPDRPEPARTSGGKSSSGRGSSSGKKGDKPKSRIVCRYAYNDAAGKLRFWVCRWEPKKFSQCHPDPSDARLTIWNMDGVERLLYHADQLAAADPAQPVYVVEGEKDADYLASRAKILATSAPGGAAAAWEPQYTEQLRGRHVRIIPDIDKPNAVTGVCPGMEHALKVARALHRIAASVKIIILPDLGKLTPKWDISNWIDAGGKPSEFYAAVEVSPEFDPTTAPPAPAAPVPGCPAAAGSPPGTTGTARAGQSGSASDPAPNESLTEPHRLARLFIRQQSRDDTPCVRYWRENWYRWDGPAYKRLHHVEVKAMIAAFVKAEFDRINVDILKNWAPEDPSEMPPFVMPVSTAIVSNVLQAMTGECLVPGDSEMPCWLDGRPAKQQDAHHFISMENGLLDIRTLLYSDQQGPDEPPATIPHTPRFFSVTSIPYAFDALADCPRWQQFVAYNLERDSDRIDVLQEWFGLNLTHDMSFQKFMMLEGEGSNGKSVICAVLAGLLGESNCTHIPLENFDKEFALTQTLGKLANIASEVGEIERVGEGYLKSFTSGDRMTFNRKNKDLVDALPTARLTLATNNRPRFSDKSGGLWRRMLLLPLRIEIQDGQKIAGMDTVAFWEELGELPGIFNWAIEGLRRLREQRRFTESHLSKEAIQEYREETNPARQFLREHYHETGAGQVLTKDVYDHYRRWCEDHGNQPLADRTFGKEVKRVFKSSDKLRLGVRGDRFYVYIGIDSGASDDAGDENNDSGNSTSEIEWPNA